MISLHQETVSEHLQEQHQVMTTHQQTNVRNQQHQSFSTSSFEENVNQQHQEVVMQQQQLVQHSNMVQQHNFYSQQQYIQQQQHYETSSQLNQQEQTYMPTMPQDGSMPYRTNQIGEAVAKRWVKLIKGHNL